VQNAVGSSIASLVRDGFDLVNLVTTTSDADLARNEIRVYRRTIF